MKKTIQEAEKAFQKDEVPVGAIIVKDDQVIAKAHNLKETTKLSLAHAEVIAIKRAQKKLGRWNLSDCDLYVSLEPCLMCTGAISEARIKKIVYATEDIKGGYFSSNFDFKTLPGKEQTEIKTGILKEESQKLLRSFFQKKREESIKVRRIHRSDYEAYYLLREEVFVKEQGVPLKEEFDEFDELKSTWHVAAFEGEQLVGTMRILFQDKNIVRVGRLAVKKTHRMKGIGSRLLYYAEKQAKAQNVDEIRLSAQVKALDFYKEHGYRISGASFLDAGIPHMKMKKTINVSRET